MSKLPEELAALLDVPSGFERRLRFVALLSKHLPPDQQPVVVGGHAVEWYSLAEYTTGDIDLLVATPLAAERLAAWGFEERGRTWWHEGLDLIVDLVTTPLAGDWDRVIAVGTPEGEVRLIGVEDLIVDRLNACVHWKSEDDCRWARHLLKAAGDDLNRDYLQQRCTAEGTADMLSQMTEEIAG